MNISVIIPTYNRANELARCLESLTHQTYKNFEIIVCDDGSTDNTKEVVDRFKNELNITYDYAENFGGPARPRNRGIRLAKGESIAFLDSDDWWYPQKLEVSVKYIGKYDLVYHDLDLYISEDKSNAVVYGRKLNGNFTKDLLLNGNGIPNSSTLISKELLDKTGFFSEEIQLIAVEDADMWIRASKISNNFHYIPMSLGAYWVGNNISYSLKQIEKEDYLLNKYLIDLNPQEIKLAIQFRSFNNARLYHNLGYFKNARTEYFNLILQLNLKFLVKSIVGYLFAAAKIKI